MPRSPSVYILASRRNGTLYIGVTSNLRKRVRRHKNDTGSDFTRENRVHRLVWHEPHPTMTRAIQREKRIKHWRRAWKLRLIEQTNPTWRDLYPDLL